MLSSVVWAKELSNLSQGSVHALTFSPFPARHLRPLIKTHEMWILSHTKLILILYPRLTSKKSSLRKIFAFKTWIRGRIGPTPSPLYSIKHFNSHFDRQNPISTNEL